MLLEFIMGDFGFQGLLWMRKRRTRSGSNDGRHFGLPFCAPMYRLASWRLQWESSLCGGINTGRPLVICWARIPFPPTTTTTMTTLFSWISEIDTGAWLLIIPFVWFGLIFYYIPWKNYVDEKALNAKQRAADQQKKDVWKGDKSSPPLHCFRLRFVSTSFAYRLKSTKTLGSLDSAAAPQPPPPLLTPHISHLAPHRTTSRHTSTHLNTPH